MAKELLGRFLIREWKDGKKEKLKIIETEAYEGFEDKASHASRGKTARNSPMFAEAGTIYVYFTYGMHYMLNIVCGPKNHPSAVLIRGITHPQPLSYIKRGEKTKNINLSGPGRLTKYLKIDKTFNNQKLGKKIGLWIKSPKQNTKIRILKTPRVGVAYAGPAWSRKLYRFVLK